jgi:hypothetical protein
MKLHWVETVVCTRPLPCPRIVKWDWKKIYDNGQIQFWVCTQDLKEQFVQEAKIAFGKSLTQIVRMGDAPEILFTRSK